MSILAAIAIFGLPPWLGYVILRSLGLRFTDDRYGFIGWVHVTGCLGIGLYLALWMIFGLPLTESIGVPIVLLCAWLHFRVRRRDNAAYVDESFAARIPETPDSSPRYQRIGFGLVVGGILVFSALAMSSGSSSAITSGDEIRHWTFKAKMIYDSDGFGPDFEKLAAEADRSEEFWQVWDQWLVKVWPSLKPDFKKRTPGPGTKWDYHLDYPLLNPLLHVWAYACAGEILHWQNRFLITGFTLALLLILAGALRSLTRPAPLIGALILLTVFGLVETLRALKWSLADGMVAAGLLLTVEALRRFRQDGHRGFWYLTIIGMTVMVWSKNEGMLYLACVVLGSVTVRLKPKLNDLLWLALPIVIVCLTWISNGKYGFTNDLITKKSPDTLKHLEPVTEYFMENIFTAPWWSGTLDAMSCNWLHLAFLGLLLLFPKIAFGRQMRMITITVLVMICGQFLVYLGTPHKLQWHLRESALRFAWQGMSLVGLWIGMTSSLLLKPER